MNSSEQKKNRRISVDLPDHYIERFDQLRREWGLRARGSVLERLLEEILPEEELESTADNISDQKNKPLLEDSITNEDVVDQINYDENTALVLVEGGQLQLNNKYVSSKLPDVEIGSSRGRLGESEPGGIDLPGFVRGKSSNLRKSLIKSKHKMLTDKDPTFALITPNNLQSALLRSESHWVDLYGQSPGDNVIEAAMIWLARDIWPNVDDSVGLPFTWTVVNIKMQKYCKSWEIKPPSFPRIIVIAAVLEDPFACDKLSERMPTLIRRFVNRFKRSRNVTSFETIESTMTVHGALKLLDLPTKAGSSLTLKRIREAYKLKATECHPDAGGSTESMRRLNEAYQLLKDLYRQKN